jgi:DNA-binding SARP family transcriptional activator
MLRGHELMRWRLLGTLRLVTDAGQANPESGKQSCVLAALLLTPGRPVPVTTLVERVWDGEPPRSATAVAPYATRIRRVLETVAGAGVLRHSAGGYLFDCDPDLVDLHRMRRRVREARGLAADDAARAGELFAEALADWSWPRSEWRVSQST